MIQIWVNIECSVVVFYCNWRLTWLVKTSQNQKGDPNNWSQAVSTKHDPKCQPQMSLSLVTTTCKISWLVDNISSLKSPSRKSLWFDFSSWSSGDWNFGYLSFGSIFYAPTWQLSVKIWPSYEKASTSHLNQTKRWSMIRIKHQDGYNNSFTILSSNFITFKCQTCKCTLLQSLFLILRISCFSS